MIPLIKVKACVMKKYMIFYIAAVLCCCLADAGTPEFTPERVPVVGEAWPEESGNFTFAILGDKTSGGEGKWPIYDRAVETINGLAPDFAITTGDQIPGHMEERGPWDAEWAEYFEHARKLKCPLVMIPGNHDISNTQCHQFWREDFGASYFSFVYGGCLFLVLNTEEERFDGRGPVWEAMMSFAEKALEEYKQARHTFVFFHKPMWADPRFAADWNRLLAALGERRFTAIAGHEHYLSTSCHNDNPLVILNATGGGIQESEVREFGCFHAFAHVSVDEKGVQMDVIEPDGARWPVDIAPASFRDAINRQVVRLDAVPPEGLGTPEVRVNAFALLKNPFDTAIVVRLSAGPLHACGWSMYTEPGVTELIAEDTWSKEYPLEPGQECTVPIYFQVSGAALCTPPAVTWKVRYRGHWLEKESMPMEEVNVVPLYPVSLWRDIPKWQVAGPFPLGSINTSALPHDPAAANANFFKEFGPERGYQADARYEGNIAWQPATSAAKGLLNHNALLGTADLAAAYNQFAVFSPEDQLTHAVLYADNYAQVYLNGTLVESAQEFGPPGGWVYAPLALKKGWNTVVVKVINNRGDWFLRFLLADPENNLAIADRVQDLARGYREH